MREPLRESKYGNEANATSSCTNIQADTQSDLFEGMGANSQFAVAETRTGRDRRSLIADVSDAGVSHGRPAIRRSIFRSAELIVVRWSIGDGDNDRIAVRARSDKLPRRQPAKDAG
jgi:hypothetical protein